MTRYSTFREMQKALKSRELSLRIKFHSLTKKEKDILARTVKLQEEVGELANDILSILSLQRKSKLDEFNKKNIAVTPVISIQDFVSHIKD